MTGQSQMKKTDDSRLETFRRPGAAEEFIAHLNTCFGMGERAATAGLGEAPEFPSLFVIGAPRSGTTVLMQWLANWPAFGVPTNLLARFHQAPYLGGLVQRLLTDQNLGYLDELAIPGADQAGFQSVIGKTAGILSPHEFFYLWRRFFPLDRGRALTDAERKLADPAGFARALRHLEAALTKPLAMKAIIMQYEIALIAAAVPKSVFLFTRRDEVGNCDSILESRKRVHGSAEEWFSVKPPGIDRFLTESPVVQVAAQVALTNDLISGQLQRLDPARVIQTDHEAFCDSPESTALSIVGSFSRLGCHISPHPCPGTFVSNRRQPANREELREALKFARQHHDNGG